MKNAKTRKREKFMDEDLEPTQDSVYKVGESKTIEELQKLDANDESLRKWKESLGLSAAQSGADSRKIVVLNMALQVEGRPDLVMDLTNLSII
jgi:Rho GDP-dissociation inhibitor